MLFQKINLKKLFKNITHKKTDDEEATASPTLLFLFLGCSLTKYLHSDVVQIMTSFK